MERRKDDAAKPGTRDLGSLAGRVIEPALLRRAGLTYSIASNWTAIAGPSLAAVTRPVRVRWGRRADPAKAPPPGTLVVACEGAAAIRVQHEADQIVERVNAVFGRGAIGAVRIEQRPIAREPKPPRVVEPTRSQREDAVRRAARIEHDGLRNALSHLGARVIAASASTSPSNFAVDNIAADQPPSDPARTEPD